MFVKRMAAECGYLGVAAVSVWSLLMMVLLLQSKQRLATPSAATERDESPPKRDDAEFRVG